MTRFQGSHVLITGAATPLGRLLALGATRRGARVTLLDRDEPRLGEVCEAVQSQGGDAEGFLADMAAQDAIQATHDEVLRTRGAVDILLHLVQPGASGWTSAGQEEGLPHAGQADSTAGSGVVHAVLPSLQQRARGHVVMVASTDALTASSGAMVCSASCQAAMGFGANLRQELKGLGTPVQITVVYLALPANGTGRPLGGLRPNLKPEDVAERILRAVEEDRHRLVLPWFVDAVQRARRLPPVLVEALRGMLGTGRPVDDCASRR